MMAAYHRRLFGDDEELKKMLACRWTEWEMAISRLYIDPEMLAKAEDVDWCLQFALLERWDIGI